VVAAGAAIEAQNLLMSYVMPRPDNLMRDCAPSDCL
jgi:hypothetical protein